MVVVGGADNQVGQEIMVLVKRLHHTAQGRMIAEEATSHETRRHSASIKKKSRNELVSCMKRYVYESLEIKKLLGST